jgi:hypothetical protein
MLATFSGTVGGQLTQVLLYIDIYIKYLLLFQILIKLEFSRQSFEQYSANWMKIRQVGAVLFHADG